MITDLILHNHPRMKTITLNDNHIAHLNAKNTTKLEYLNLSNNNLLPTNDIDQLISSKHLWHVLVNGINNDPLAQMQYWTAVRNIIDDTNEVTIDLSGLNLTTQPPGLQNFTSINLDNNQLTHFNATNYDRLVKLSLNSNTLESINFPQGRNVSITHISMNNNALRNINIDRLSSVTYFSAAHNQLEFVQLESCEWLQYLNLSHWRSGRLFYSAGVWHVAQYDRLSGRRDESVFNLLHRLCAADLAGLWSAEVQPKIRDRCLMYNRVASDKASDPNSFLEQESCHE